AKVRAASLWAGERSAISHGAAAALWQIGDLLSHPVVVTTERSLKSPPGLSVRRIGSFGPADVTVLEGMAVTTPARTLLDLAAVAPIEAVEAAVDDALRSRLVSLAKLRWFVQTYGGRGRAGPRR
ncbi:MAG: hypothetical protein M3279_11690, partial [Actinomycetota bacterium]|nr:hypothetical protein [Actinomycetota bacterium]